MDKNFIDYLGAIGSIATPFIVLTLTAIGWKFKSKLERLSSLEDKLREDRINTYNNILEPFIISLMSDGAWQSDKRHKHINKNDYVVSKMLSLEYRNHAFKLALVGSDSVVRSYNNLMQYFYNQEDGVSDPKKVKDMLDLIGNFLLEIRKSMGNEATKLDNFEMLEWFIKDARQLRRL